MSGSNIPPGLTVAANGQGIITDQWQNTAVQGGALLANLRAFVGISNMTVYMLGTTAPNDGGQGTFYWNATSIAADDGGVTTIQPNGLLTGRWIRSTLASATSEWNAGTVTAVGANLTLTPGGTLSASAVVGSTTTVVAGAGLSGGTISTTGTLAVVVGSGLALTGGTVNLASIAAATLLGNGGAVGAVPTGVAVGSGLALTGGTLSSPAALWSAGTVNAVAGGLAITAATLSAPTALYAVGTYLVGQYRASVPSEGANYAGSGIYNVRTSTPYGAPGSWRCMGTIVQYQPLGCCLFTYAICLWLRTS